MGKSKTPKSSNDQKRNKWQEITENNPLSQAQISLTTTLKALYSHVDKEEMNNGAGALETLFILDRHLNNENFPRDWRNNISPEGGDHVNIPSWVFRTIVDSWTKYIGGDAGLSLGNAFGVGTGGQGKRKFTREGVKNFRRHFGLAFQVMMACMKADEKGAPLSFEKAYGDVADRNGVSSQTVGRAYSEYKQILKEIATEQQWPVDFPD